MSNVVISRETQTVSGVDRTPLPYEFDIQNVSVDELTKQEPYEIKVEKTNEEGQPLYYYQKPPVFEVVEDEKMVETTEDTGIPVMIEGEKKVPLLDANKRQVTYEKVELDEEENQLSTGVYFPCFTTEIVDVQKTNEAGEPLFYKLEKTTKTVTTEFPLEEITEDDENYVEGLTRALKPDTRYNTVSFADKPESFTYDDIVAAKEVQILRDNPMHTEVILHERMDEDLFSTDLTNFNADLGVDFIHIPVGGQVRTEKILFANPHKIVAVKLESEGYVTVSVGDKTTTLTHVDQYGEVSFNEPAEGVYVWFKNTTDSPIQINSFAIMG